MEERLIDKDDERLIRIKKKADGVDAEDATLPEGEEPQEEEEEVLVTLPEDDEDYDEDLVGLTPSELAKELARRKKAEEQAKAECEKLVASAEEKLAEGAYKEAESLFEQASRYGLDEKIEQGLWTARTENFTSTEPFYNEDYAEEFSALDDASKKFVRDKVADRLIKEREEIEKEEKELAPAVLEKQEERRQAFADNRKYYALRLLVALAFLGMFVIATIVSSSFIVRTLSSIPIILTGVFGGLTLISFVISLVFFLKFTGANKLCSRNEKLSSTEEGARLEELRGKLECLKLILEDEE